MKKVLLFLFVAAIAFTGCKKDSEEENALVGKYKGTFTTIGKEAKEKKATVRITEGAGEKLMLDYVIDLTKISDGRYEYSSENSFSTTLLSTLLTLCGLDNEYFDAAVKKIDIDARFSDNQLNLEIQYTTDLGLAATTTFKGTKQE